jgi:hypothetical protein
MVILNPEEQMDNRLNGLRRKIKLLRLEMLDLQVSVRDQIKCDRDCTQSSVRLMDMRRELTVLVREWTRLGGGDRLPTIQERLRECYRPVVRPKPAAISKVQKRRAEDANGGEKRFTGVVRSPSPPFHKPKRPDRAKREQENSEAREQRRCNTCGHEVHRRF